MNGSVAWLKGIGERLWPAECSDSLRTDSPSSTTMSSTSQAQFWNGSSILALLLIVAPLTIGAIGAFPLWDDAWNWLYLKERGADFVAAIPDRPVMAYLWTMLGASEDFFWNTNIVLHAVVWSAFGVISALLWRRLFPELSGYGWAVACLTVAPLGFHVQFMLVNVVLGPLLSIVLAYAAFLMLLRYVRADDGTGWKALAVGQIMLASSIIFTEYALSALAVMVILLLFPLQKSYDLQDRDRRYRAMALSILVGGLTYGGYYLLAEWSANTQIMYAHPPIAKRFELRQITNALQAFWQGLGGNLAMSVSGIRLTAKSDAVGVLYGILAGALLVVGCRMRHSNQSAAPSSYAILILGLGFFAGLAPLIYSGRLPWNPDDGITARFGLAALPISAMLLLASLLHIVRQRFWMAPVFLIGLIAGQTAFTESWGFVRERIEVAEMGRAVRPFLSNGDGLTVAVIATPARKFGPPRQWELTARLAADWPATVRDKFWAVRYGGNPPLTWYLDEAGLIFGTRDACVTPKSVDLGTRLVKREGKLDRLLWVERRFDGTVSVGDYCVKDTAGLTATTH